MDLQEKTPYEKTSRWLTSWLIGVLLILIGISYIADSISYGPSGYAFIGITVIAYALNVVSVRKRKFYVEVYGFHKDCLEKDLREEHTREIFKWIGCYGAVLFGVLLAMFVSVKDSFLPAYLIHVFGGTIYFVPWYRHGKKIRQGKYLYSTGTLVRTEKDEDGYYFYYSDGNREWKTKVSLRAYLAATRGETTVGVFLEGEKKPYIVYSRR